MRIDYDCDICGCDTAKKLNCFASRNNDMCLLQVQCENCGDIGIVQTEWGVLPCLHKGTRCDSENLVFH